MKIKLENTPHKRAFFAIYIKISFNEKHDNIGSGPINLPPEELHTNATWLSFDVPAGWSESKLTDAMTGAAYAIKSFIPMFVSCDRSDIHVIPQVKAVHTEKPTIFVHDSYPGGIGLSEAIFKRWSELIKGAAEHVSACRCVTGCPICIGAQEPGVNMKETVADLLQTLFE